MFQKLENGWQLAKASAAVLRSDKELLMLPLLSGLAMILVTASFFLPMAFLGDIENLGIVGYVAVFVFYVVQYFVIIFFNTALVGAAMIRLDGGDPTVGDGLRIAWQRLGSILGYAAIAATVGMILRSARERAGFIGRIAIGIIGFAWSLATFLVVPVLVTKNLGPIEAVKESARMMKKTWGEQIVGNVGIGLVFFLVYAALAIIAVPSIGIVASMGQPVLLIVVIALAVMAALGVAALQSALTGIYSAALYRFADTGSAGGPFDETQLQQAFLPKAH